MGDTYICFARVLTRCFGTNCTDCDLQVIFNIEMELTKTLEPNGAKIFLHVVWTGLYCTLWVCCHIRFLKVLIPSCEYNDYQWRFHDFPQAGHHPRQPIIWSVSPKKVHGNEEILYQKGSVYPSQPPPQGCVTDYTWEKCYLIYPIAFSILFHLLIKYILLNFSTWTAIWSITAVNYHQIFVMSNIPRTEV